MASGTPPGTVLVTGAARRLGAHIARGLAADGWRVVLHCHQSVAEAEALAVEIGAVGVVPADLGQRAAIEGLIGRASAWGPLDALINNASVFEKDDIADLTWESFDAHIVPNLAAPMFLSRDFARAFGERTGGNIVNLLDQKIGNLNPDFLSYTVSKVALAGVTRLLAMAFGARIRVNGVAPGLTMISTRQTPAGFDRAQRSMPLGRGSTPSEIAAAVRFLLATPSITGQVLTLDGGESLFGRARDVSLDPRLQDTPSPD